MTDPRYPLTITMPVSTLNHVMTNRKDDYEKLYQDLNIQKREGFPASADLTLAYSRTTLDELIRVMQFLYFDSGNQALPVGFGGREFGIQDPTLMKLLEQAVWGPTNSVPGIAQKKIQDLISGNRITNVNAFQSLSGIPFSGLMVYDRVDLYCLLKDPGYFTGEKSICDPLTLNQDTQFVLSNRYIGQDITIRGCGSVKFSNCVITGKIDVTDVEDIHIYNCIITGSIIARNLNKLKLHSSNVRKLLICRTEREAINATDTVDLVDSKIFRFEFLNSNVNHFDMIRTEITEACMTDLKISSPNFRSSQFDLSKLTPEYMRDERPGPEDSFYLSFQSQRKEKATSPDERALDTIDAMLQYGNFDHDHNAYADLKYRKMLYSNSGFRRFFVRFTGGYYKPSRWVFYLLAVMLVFSGLYCAIPDGFSSVMGGDTFSLDLLTALQFSVLQLIGANTMAIVSVGICQILTILHASLNATIIANFFAAIVKRYMTA